MDNPMPEAGRRIAAIRDILIKRNVVSADELAQRLSKEAARSWINGAKIVANAWVDPAFRSQILTDGKLALNDLDINADEMAEFVVLENTERVHHLIVCTLCSCYPRAVLGDPPQWYKSEQYRARAVREPRLVLEEFGMTLPEDIEVIVVDSTASRRFMVLPRRPVGSEGFSKDALANLVTRNSLVGVGDPTPAHLAASGGEM